jgi:hypothetical protein
MRALVPFFRIRDLPLILNAMRIEGNESARPDESVAANETVVDQEVDLE